jgi:hypothetical protein
MRLLGRRVTEPAGSPASGPIPASPLALPAWLDPFAGPSPGDYASGNAGRLARASGRLRVAGELIAFAGVIAMFMATLFWPANPAELAALEGWIFVPGSLGQIPFTSPSSYAITPAVDISPLTINLALLTLTVMGAGAIMRGRWLLAGLVGAFFLLPWSLLGFDLTLKPLVLPFYGALLAFRLCRPLTVKLALLVPVLVVGTPIAINLFGSIYANLGRTPETAAYRKIAFADLAANQGKPAQEAVPDRKPVERLTSLSGLSPLAAAAPYVMAQEHALRGDAPAAARALDEAIARGFLPNRLDRQRIDAIERYAANEGALGTVRQSAVQAAYGSGLLLAWIAFAGGLALAAVGPASSFLADRMARRAKRIDEAEDHVRSAQAAQQVFSFATRSGRDAGQRPSSAVFDSQTMMAAMSRRIRAYARAAGWMAAAATLCALGSWWYWLPPAASNSAFRKIELVPEVLKLAHTAGQSGITTGGLSDGVLLVIWLGALFAYFCSVLIIKARSYRLGTALAVALYSFVLPSPFFPNSGSLVALSDLQPGLRAQLMALGTAELAPSGGLSRTFAMIETGKAPLQADSAAAAYTLAQIAYLENRPADAASMLNRMLDRSIIRARRTEQRTDLMIEWAVAHGQPAPAWLASPQRERPTAPARSLARALSIVAIAAAAAMLVPLGLLGYAWHRRKRIEALVAERQGGRFDSDGAARRRLTRLVSRTPMPG